MSVVIPSATSKLTSGFDPRAVPGCMLWLDGADPTTVTQTGNIVTSLRDKSSNAYTLSNGTGFTYNQTPFNGSYPSFYKSDTTFAPLGQNASFGGSQPLVTFIVGQPGFASNSGTFPYLLDSTNSASRIAMYYWGSNGYRTRLFAGGEIEYTGTSSAPFIHSYVANTTSSSIFTDGTLRASGSIGTGSFLGILVAANWVGHIAEILLYNGSLTTLQRQQVEGYLAAKWGLQSNLPATHPYKTIRPFVRPLIPTDVGIPEFWFDPADRTVVTATGNTFTSLSNKGTTQGSNLVVSTGTPTYGTATQNGLPCIGMPTTTDRLVFVGSFPTQVRTRFFAVRPTSDISRSGDALTLLNQNLVSTSGNDTIVFTNSTLTELAQGIAFRIQTSALSQQSNIFSVYTVRNASTTASNYIGSNGNSLTLTTNTVAASYNTASASNYMNTGGGNPGTFDLGEFISFNSQLTSNETQQIEGYLAWKWGTQSRLPASHLFSKFPPVVSVFTPLQLSTCALWLDAADVNTITMSGSNVAQWNDKSGNGRNGTTTGTVGYQSNAINRLNAVSYTAALNSYIRGSLSNTGTTVTCFAVATMNSTTRTNSRILSLGVAGTIDYGSTLYTAAILSENEGIITYRVNGTTARPVTFGVPFVAGCLYDATNKTVFVNGSGSSNASTGTFNISNYQIGVGLGEEATTRLWNGYIGEIIVFNSALTTLQRQQVEGYLAHKWGLRANLPTSHPYRLVKP